ncbi:MAG: ribosome biogenesis/translation initiation ATPase RLI [Candidatus Woesearchaeota archaeon]
MPRIAVVDKERCHPMECGNYLCVRVCPVNRNSIECIVEDTDTKIKIIEETCIGCNICVVKCPFDAISIINLPEELKEAPIHRYGENNFALFRLPMPLFGKVVGIIGRNGIGKSTAIKILAEAIKPNFGGKQEVSYDELIQHFKGTEAQNFFEKVKKGEIKVSYKPQQVDLIPKHFSGKVKDLLKKSDEKNEFEKIVELLGLKEILDRDLNQISGGELQRVAIGATVLKKANLYIFDEPTSFLDIKQRIKVAQFIKNLANEQTAVLVIEHDLIILDYMADLIHIMYGKESCYGIVSGPKSTREGINAYLTGQIKEENVRFRDKEIKFDVKPTKKTIKGEELLHWKGLRQKLGTFSIEANEGNIQRNEIVGVLGENGIGKTSFVKMLAGVTKSDAGEVSLHVKIGYKPQYIDNESEQTVEEVLKDAMQFENEIIVPLNIKPLFERKINELSGGELQRVAIALCLSRDAKLMLMDEPSAYLDIEQRLVVSKIIKHIAETKGKSMLIVDHDLMFIDNLSDRLLVFDGKPAINGVAHGPFEMEQGMNKLLKELNITLRRDETSKRPRINKPDSVKDREQKSANKYYYS